MLIIMIAGKAGSGKDEVANIICKHSNKAKRFAFADNLKSMARSLGWDGNKDERGRLFLQQLGKVGRNYNPDVWAKFVEWQIRDELLDTHNNLFVISDFRFPNEYAVLHKRWKDIITIKLTGRASDLGSNANDISEHSLESFKFDYVIDNSGTLQELEDDVLNILGGCHVYLQGKHKQKRVRTI